MEEERNGQPISRGFVPVLRSG